MEKSNIELLEEFAIKTKREVYTEEKDYKSQFSSRFPKFKRTVYIVDKSDLPVYFILYSDPYYKMAIDTVFCGVYIPISVPTASKITFTKKNFIDRMNPFPSKEIIKSGDFKFDSKILMKGNNPALAQKLARNILFQRLLIESFKMKEFFYFSINDTDVDFVEDLKGKSHFSICNPINWILDFDVIEEWFKVIKKFQRVLNEETMYTNSYKS